MPLAVALAACAGDKGEAARRNRALQQAVMSGQPERDPYKVRGSAGGRGGMQGTGGDAGHGWGQAAANASPLTLMPQPG